MKCIGFLLSVSMVLLSCEKEISIDLPQAEIKPVVEGSIETDQPPIILLTKSSNYFDPTDINSVAASFIDNATIEIAVDNGAFSPMTQICSQNLPPAQQQLIAQELGVDLELVQNFNICGYTHSLTGENGKSYSIKIDWEGKSYTSTTQIPNPVPLDSAWFLVEGGLDSLGFIWAKLKDPAGVENQYRWYAKRINSYDYGPLIGEQKDNTFYAPFGSAFNDDFFDGLDFDFPYNRQGAQGSEKEDDGTPEGGYFKLGDTVAIKFCAIDSKVENFIDKMDQQRASNGSPFAAPSNLPSNVEGGLGMWAGYGLTFDTVVCQ